MAAPPTTAKELLQLVDQSGVVAAADLRKFVDQASRSTTPAPSDAVGTARLMIQSGLITRFQAEQLLAGRHRGFVVGRYKVLDLLGIGAMGRVYLAEHSFMQRQVALKLLPKSKATDPSALGRFHREARAIAALNHPNIVQAYDFDQAEGMLFIVMEYVNGKSIQEFVQRHGPVPWPQAVDYICQTAAGLQHALEVGIVHRDIKPGNLLLDRSGVIKILDMGLARIFTDTVEKHGEPLSRMYNEQVLGTADYLAPEQAVDSHNVDIRADIYALGYTMYFMLAGRGAVPEGSIAQKLVWHQRNHPAPIQTLVPDLPAEVVALLEQTIAKRPADRFQIPSELRQAFLPYACEVRTHFDTGSSARLAAPTVENAAATV